jgi:hypothetical protein
LANHFVSLVLVGAADIESDFDNILHNVPGDFGRRNRSGRLRKDFFYISEQSFSVIGYHEDHKSDRLMNEAGFEPFHPVKHE